MIVLTQCFYFHFALSVLVQAITYYHQLMDVVREQGSVWELAKHKHWAQLASNTLQTHIWTFFLLFPFRRLSLPLFTSCVFLTALLHCYSLWVSGTSVCGFWMFAPVSLWKVAFISTLSLPASSLCLSVHACLFFPDRDSEVQEFLSHWKFCSLLC